MKPRAQIILVGALLVGVAVLSLVKRAARSDAAGQNRGPCCPLMPGLDVMLPPSGTNGSVFDCNTNTPPATNHP